MTYKVFISYSTKDFPLADYVRNLLQHSSVEVFVAEYSVVPGQSLPVEIIAAIKNCNLFILLWSENSKESEWVPQEIGIATSEKKPILPVVPHQKISLPGFISSLKYLPLYKIRTAHCPGFAQMYSSRRRRRSKQTGSYGSVLGQQLYGCPVKSSNSPNQQSNRVIIGSA